MASKFDNSFCIRNNSNLNFYLDKSTDVLKDKLFTRLKELKNADHTEISMAYANDDKADDVLNIIYYTGLEKMSFTEEEQKTLGPLLNDAITPIQINVERTASTYRTRLDSSVLMKRSAIQFLIDNYGQFQVETSTLSEFLEKSGIKESVEMLDDLIATWCNTTDSDEGSSDIESGVPSSHTWWPK